MANPQQKPDNAPSASEGQSALPTYENGYMGIRVPRGDTGLPSDEALMARRAELVTEGPHSQATVANPSGWVALIDLALKYRSVKAKQAKLRAEGAQTASLPDNAAPPKGRGE